MTVPYFLSPVRRYSSSLHPFFHHPVCVPVCIPVFACSMIVLSSRFAAPDDVSGGVLVESWLPAGLEPLDPNVPSTGSSSSTGSSCAIGGGYRWWWWCPAFERETFQDRVVFTAGRGMRAKPANPNMLM